LPMSSRPSAPSVADGGKSCGATQQCAGSEPAYAHILSFGPRAEAGKFTGREREPAWRILPRYSKQARIEPPSS
jgi:hypothetical protein